MNQALHLPQTYRRDFYGFGARIRAIVRALAAEHTLALRASTKARLARQNLTELRAMYARSGRLIPVRRQIGRERMKWNAGDTSASARSSHDRMAI